MPTTVGIWIYRFEVYPINGRTKVGIDDSKLAKPPKKVLQEFIKAHGVASTDEDRQRIWYFEKPHLNEGGETNGYIRYGTYGFESNFIDSKTREQKYKRETHHYEDIPLYYQFWFPDKQEYGLMLLQSFGGRSCVSYVRDAFRERFFKANDGFSLRIRKIVPAEVLASALDEAPVSGFTFVKKVKNGDKFSGYGGTAPQEIDLELTMKARKAGSFGPFGVLEGKDLLQHAGSMFLKDDEAFDRVAALVKIGKNTRKISVFGHSGEAGSVDVTGDVSFDENGHPNLDSLEEVCNDLMLSLNKALSGKK